MLVLCTLLLSGCGSSSGGIGESIGGLFFSSSAKVGPETSDDLGDGVLFSISSIDDSNLQDIGTVSFDLKLESNNIEPVEIFQEKLVLSTIPETNLEYNTVFSPESISKFYELLFNGRNSVLLSESWKIDKEFSLEVDESQKQQFAPYLGNEVIMIFDLEFSDSFEYFSNLNLNFKTYDVNSEDLVKKKGPFDVHSFELKSGSNDRKLLFFTIEGITNSGTKIMFSNTKVTLAGYELFCSISSQEDSFTTQEVLTNINNELTFICTVASEIADLYTDDTQFTFSISLDYTQSETISQLFTMPTEFYEFQYE